MTDIESVIEVPARLGECPVWSVDEQVLYWVDIDGRAVHRHDPAAGTDELRTTDGRPGAIALTDTPRRLLLAIEHELRWFDWDSGESTPFVALEQPGTGNRLNDGRCDPAGRFVVGSMYSDTGARRRSGILHSIDGDGTHRMLRTGIGVSNGLAFDSDRGLAYFADTHTDRVIVWDHDPETGARRNERLFVDYSDLPGGPDGACVDADGCYWSASVHGSALVRFTPDGELERRIELPVELPTMPAFGGPDLSTLYVTSIATAATDAGRADGIVDGMLLRVDPGPGITGVPEPRFAAP